MVPSPWPSLVGPLPWFVGRPSHHIGGPSLACWWTLFLDSLVDPLSGLIGGCTLAHWWILPAGSLVDPSPWLVGGPSFLTHCCFLGSLVVPPSY
ncbi:hypothetical protein BDR04DRAFT_1103497 [Suillus decipiens]|nr:hypothetical protein BDR04DRAFT_1103497 [Suillus decipiens]